MSKAISFFITSLILFTVNSIYSQRNNDYFQQHVSYEIEAEISENKLHAIVDITYTNQSPNVLDTLYFHLWMNALSQKNTPFSKQLLNANLQDFYFFRPNELGGYRNVSVSINQKPTELKFQANSNEIAFVVLPTALLPQTSTSITFSYDLKLPKLITRMGINKEITQLIHWYPRLAVYDLNKWHTFPYLSWGEFYGEYSDFNVTLTHSDSTKVVAPFVHSSVAGITKINSKKVIDCPIIIYPDKSKVVSKTEQSDNIKYMSHYYRDSTIWEKAIPIAKEVIDFYAQNIGPFPFKEIVITQGSSNLTSAMEYPGLILINEVESEKALEYYIAHEIAHQYFYAALGFNERDESFMDEGLATFFEDKYTTHKYKRHYYNEKTSSFIKIEEEPLLLLNAHRHQYHRHQNQSMDASINEITPINYGINNYPRAAYLFKLVEEYLGKETFRQALSAYYLRSINTHVNQEDFFTEMESMTKKSFEWVDYILTQKDVNFTLSQFQEKFKITADRDGQWPIPISFESNGNHLDTTIILNDGVSLFPLPYPRVENVYIDPNLLYRESTIKDNILNRKYKLSVVPILGQNKIFNYEIFAVPLVKYTTSDKWMPSIALFNSTFPSQKLKWMLNPSYSIINKEINGQAWIKYDYFINKNTKNYLQPELSFKRFSFEKNLLFGYNLNYTKFGTGLSYIKNSTPKILSTLSIKYDYISEERARFSMDGSRNGFENLYFSNLRMNYELDINKSPTRTKFQTTLSYLPKYGDQNDNFLRLDLSLIKQYFYSQGKSFDVRLWTGYFIQNTKRYSLSYNSQLLRGSTALSYQVANDYAYDYHFIDRNNGSINQASSGLGGGFKTVFNNRNLGQTNDLAFSINLKCDLPIKSSKYLPLSAYFDFGGYSIPVNQKSSINYLYSGGLSLTYLKGALQMHLPIINSEDINRIYSEEGGFFQRISFTLDLSKINLWTQLDHLEFYLNK